MQNVIIKSEIDGQEVLLQEFETENEVSVDQVAQSMTDIIGEKPIREERRG